jgi:hypothetical protein
MGVNRMGDLVCDETQVSWEVRWCIAIWLVVMFLLGWICS